MSPSESHTASGSPTPDELGSDENEVVSVAEELNQKAEEIMSDCQFHIYIEKILELADATNRYIDKTEPFKLAKDQSQQKRLATILYTCAEAVRIILLYLYPIMPETAQKGLSQLGYKMDGELLSSVGKWGQLAGGTQTHKGEGLFPRMA